MPTKKNAVRLLLQGPEPSLTKLNLTIANKQETSYITHSTNWDSSLDSTNFRSKSFLNSFSARTFSFASTDLGSHRYDRESWSNSKDSKGHWGLIDDTVFINSRSTKYEFNTEWTPNDIALLDDIAIVATDSYCSTEKRTWNINSSVWTYYFSKISIEKYTTCNELMSMELFGTEETTGEVIDFWIYICLSPEQGGETISVTTFDCLENPTTVSYILPVVNNYICDYTIQVQSCELFEPTTDWPSYVVSSTAPSPPSVSNVDTDSTIDITNPSEPPADPIDMVQDLGVNISTLDNIITEKKYDCYYNKNRVNFNYTARSNFFIPMTLGMIYDHNPIETDLEVADLSDVYIEINYSKNTEETSSTTASVVDSDSINSDNNRIIYKFGGYSIDTPNLAGLRYTNARFAAPKGKNIIDYENDYFYFPVYDKVLKTITGVVLSSCIDFKLPENREDWNFKGGYVPTGYNRIHGKNIPVDSIKIHKITNYPNCGKVDIYLKKSGFVQEFSYGSIVSNKHGLQDYDIIKITDSFNIDLEYAVWQEDNGYIYEESESAYLMIERLNRSLSGIKYVKVIDSFTFQIFDDPELTQIIAVPIQLSFNSSLEWTCIGNHLDHSNQAWNYHSSIYSPDGKNGYGTKRILRQLIENQSMENIEYDQTSDQSPKILIDYAVPTPDFSDEPVRYDNSLRSVSWTNHYPFKRTVSEGAPKVTVNNRKIFDMDIKNGNRFGSEVKLLKYNDSTYFMLISERGATDSFRICNEFSLGFKTSPFNCKSIPTFLPYGKIHIYKLNTTNKKISSIEYLKSISAPNHPWAEYENKNIDYRSGKIDNTVYNLVNYQLTNYGYASSTTRMIDNFNATDDPYWIGAKFLHWTYEYTPDLFFTYSPNDTYKECEFGFIDCFGKSFDVQLVDNATTPKTNWYASDLKLIISAESNNTSEQNFHLYFYNSVCPIYGDPVFNLEQLPPIYNYYNSPADQKLAAARSMNKVIYKSPNVILSAFSSLPRVTEASIYVYETTNTQYKDTQYYFDSLSLIQKFSPSIDKDYAVPTDRRIEGFGNFFAFDGNFLVSNGGGYYGDNNNEETYITDYLYIYKKKRDGKFEFLQKISPTIDISDPKYENAITFPVSFSSKNLSYVGTSDNSRTYKTYLLKRYDINNGILVLRDPLEYSVFQYNKSENKFKFKFSNFIDITFDSEDYYYSKRILTGNPDPDVYNPTPDLIILNSSQGTTFPRYPKSNVLIKIANSTSPSTFTSRGVFDSSEKKPSTQIFEYSHFYKTADNINSAYRGGDGYLKIKSGDLSSANYNVLTSIDFPNPNYGLPLYMDVLETANNSLQLRNLGHSFESSGIPLHLELDIKTNNSGIPLYLKQYDISNSGLKLKTAGHLSAIDGLDLRIESTVKLSDQILNLSMYDPILTTGQFGILDLRIENIYQGGVAGNELDPEDPDYWIIGTKHSGNLNLVVKTDEYIDYATRLNLIIPQGSFNQIIESGVNSETLDFYMYGDIQQVPIDSESVIGTGNNTNLNLFLKADVGAPLPLFVYNTLESGSLNLDIRGSYQDASGLNLLLDSKGIPSGFLTFYVRGFEPYA